VAAARRGPSPGVRKTSSWPRSWANFSLLQLYSLRKAWANLHLLGQPNSFLARAALSFYTLSLAAIGCHAVGIYTVVLLPLLPFAARMTVLPMATETRTPWLR
jgi:hypothetical protein